MREFVVLDREDPENRRGTLPLRDGSFLLMGGNMQSRYLHGVPAGKGDGVGLRINLTFRCCIPRERGQGPANLSRLQAEEEAARACAADEASRAESRASANEPSAADRWPA